MSIIDKDGSYSHKFEQTMSEGDRHITKVMDYDYKNKKLYYSEHKRGEKKKEETPALNDFSTDPYSCLMYLRHYKGKLEKGKSIHFPVFADQKLHRLTIDVLGREKVNLRATGVREAIKIEPKASFDGLFASSGRMFIWLDAKTNIILKADVKIKIGTAKIILLKAINKNKFQRIGIKEKCEKKLKKILRTIQKTNKNNNKIKGRSYGF